MSNFIDIFPEITNEIITKLSSSFPNAFISSEEIRIPEEFPCVCIEETNNSTDIYSVDSSGEEKYINSSIRINIYTNKESGGQSQARIIFSECAKIMRLLGYSRLSFSSTSSGNDGLVFLTARFGAVVGLKTYTVGSTVNERFYIYKR